MRAFDWLCVAMIPSCLYRRARAWNKTLAEMVTSCFDKHLTWQRLQISLPVKLNHRETFFFPICFSSEVDAFHNVRAKWSSYDWIWIKTWRNLTAKRLSVSSLDCLGRKFRNPVRMFRVLINAQLCYMGLRNFTAKLQMQCKWVPLKQYCAVACIVLCIFDWISDNKDILTNDQYYANHIRFLSAFF